MNTKKKKRWKLLPCRNFDWFVITFIKDKPNRWALGTEVFSLNVLLHKVFKPYYHRKLNTTLWKKITLLTYKKNLNTSKLQVHVSCASRDYLQRRSSKSKKLQLLIKIVDTQKSRKSFLFVTRNIHYVAMCNQLGKKGKKRMFEKQV